jgi:hypothetical protein
MNKLISALLIVAAIIHLLPLAGVLGADRLASLYGMPFEEPNLLIMMRHRAVLFGLLGLFLLYAAFNPALLPLAFGAGIISAASFLLLAWSGGGYNTAIGRVVRADLVALSSLMLALVLYMVAGRGNPSM